MAEWDAEVVVDERRARALIASRFPQVDVSELRRLGEGWDNTVWLTADGIAFRFPRRAVAVPGVEREIALLPALARELGVPVPDAAFAAVPSDDFPWPWFGSQMIDGCELATAGLGDEARCALAPRLGAFLRELHDLRLPDAAELPVDPVGRADMALRARKTRVAIGQLAPGWAPRDTQLVDYLLGRAEALPAPSAPVLVHGDLHARHVLVGRERDGVLAGVIDWGDVCRADPSVDLSLVWSAFQPAAREQFFAAYGPIDEDALLRARVLALFLCATLARYAGDTRDGALEGEMRRGLERTLRD